MPQVQALERRGLTFRNYFVSDSLCCPSRASIFTGDFPHDTHVLTNTPPTGGFDAFHVHGDESRSFNVALQHAGYQTAMMGKYLNGYLYEPGVAALIRPAGVEHLGRRRLGLPRVRLSAQSTTGPSVTTGTAPRDYLTDVLTRYGVEFIDHAAHSGRPFFLELAPFSPHYPYTAAPRYQHAFSGLRAPRPRSFRRAAQLRAAMARRPSPTHATTSRSDQPGVSQARPGRTGDRRHDRQDPGRARSPPHAAATPTSCSAQTTGCTPANTA